MNLVVGECAVEGLVGVVADLGNVNGFGQRCELELGILDHVLAAELFVGAGLLHGELASLLVIGARGLKGARTTFVEGIDGGAQILFELLLIKGIGEHGQVDVLIEVDLIIGDGGLGLAA